jgi:hypothetical protein
MRKNIVAAVAIVGGVLAAVGGVAIAAQDKYSVSVPNGMAFSEFRGFEAWQTVAVSHATDLGLIEAIVGDPAMIAAYQTGLPAVGRTFPDGVRMAKIHWKAKQSTEAPGATTIPGDLHDIDLMMKDSKRFADTGGWGYAQFNYDPATQTFSPLGTGHDCGYACHTIVKAKDYMFTSYGTR